MEKTLLTKLAMVLLCRCVLFVGYHPADSTCAGTPVDVVFVIDSSSSIRRNPGDSKTDDWGRLLHFLSALVQQLGVAPGGARVGLVKFSYVGSSVFYLDSFTDQADILYSIERVGYVGGSTNTSGGIWRMRTEQFTAAHGDRKSVPNVGVVLTDGVSTWDHHRTIPEATAARNDGIEIVVVGVSLAVDEDEIRLMSSEPHRRDRDYFLVATFQALDSIMDQIVNAVCEHAYKGTTTAAEVFEASVSPPTDADSKSKEESPGQRVDAITWAPLASTGLLVVCCVPMCVCWKKNQRTRVATENTLHMIDKNAELH